MDALSAIVRPIERNCALASRILIFSKISSQITRSNLLYGSDHAIPTIKTRTPVERIERTTHLSFDNVHQRFRERDFLDNTHVETVHFVPNFSDKHTRQTERETHSEEKHERQHNKRTYLASNISHAMINWRRDCTVKIIDVFRKSRSGSSERVPRMAALFKGGRDAQYHKQHRWARSCNTS